MSDTRKRWTKDIEKFLVGKKITHVRYMTKSEMKEADWYHNSIIIFFDDGSWINPMADDEGNNGGALATSSKTLSVIPVIGQED
tara:strand:- start:2382 stop:2633 length:252 start_codon:yes stop_codon:yes gene_type:complete